ncbi:hypothetical protein KA977_14270 [Candidatus Dependentiae bacterium]|nr:hypothetical protein [Candidatus Dependentiae bacterium]
MEKIKKIKEFLSRLPGLSSPEPKYKKIAIFLYCFVLFLWIFAIVILYINSITNDEEDNKNALKIISFDEIKIKKTNTEIVNSSRETIIENSHSKLLMNAPSTKNEYKISQKYNSLPLDKKIGNQYQLLNSLGYDAAGFEKIIISENSLVKNESVIEDSQYINLLNERETIKAPVEIINTAVEKKYFKEEKKFKVDKIKESEHLNSDSEQKKQSSGKTVTEKNVRRQNMPFDSTESIKKNETFKKNNVASKKNTKSNKEISEKKSKKENIKSAESYSESANTNKNIPNSELNDPTFLPTNLKNSQTGTEQKKNLIDKNVLNSGLKNYTENKDIIIKPENKITEPDMMKTKNLQLKSETQNNLKNKAKGNNIELMKYGELEYEPLKK